MATKTTKKPARRAKKKRKTATRAKPAAPPAKRAGATKIPKRKTPKRKSAKRKARGNGKQPKDRWTQTLVADGWTPISDFFLKNYSSLQPHITSLEAMFVVHLLQFKWTAAAPWPGFKRIADRMGVSTTSARGDARSLQNKGCLYRQIRKGQTNVFHLEPLFEKLEAHREAHPPKKNRPAPEDEPYSDFS